MTNTIHYMTVIHPVLEVTLLGNADYATWQPILQAEGFHPTHTKTIPVIISGTQARYMGVTFRELSISLGIDDERFLLIYAFNSNRFFAWAERNLFRTPYYHASIAVNSHHIAIHQGENRLFEATLPPDTQIAQQSVEDYQRIICLPKSLRKNTDMPHYFHARLAGDTQHYAPQSAHIGFVNDTANTILSRLSESQFEITDWTVRMQAHHSKSKTYLGDSSTR